MRQWIDLTNEAKHGGIREVSLELAEERSSVDRPDPVCSFIFAQKRFTLWGERERGSVVGVYVSSHRKLIGHIGCCRTESSASSLLRWSCAHWLKRVASVLSDVPLSVATYIAGGKLGFN